MRIVLVQAIFKYLSKMDNWERAAFFPYLFAPLLLSFLLLLFLLIEGGTSAAIFLFPVLILGYYTFYQIIRGRYGIGGYQFLVSGGYILYTIFFPLLLIESGISELNFTFIYIVIILPIFLGHVYTLIFQITKNLSETKPIVID